MYDVYTATILNQNYVGNTENFLQRLSLHKSRYYEQTYGSDAFFYRVARSITESFDDIEWKIVKSFKTKKAAERYEIALIKKIGTLNVQHSPYSKKYREDFLKILEGRV